MAHSPYEGQASQEHSRRTNPGTNIRSPPTSQTTSFDDSLSSDLLQGRPNAPNDLELIRPHGAITPSTFLSSKSSQESTGSSYLAEPDVSLVNHEGSVDGLMPYANDSLDKCHANAPKRMANGDFKPSEFSPATSPVDSSQFGDSRNSSTTSRGSQIGELSDQLRTRLSYAMFKVQNGWQSHNINELERMASSQVSPVSAVSDVHRLYERQLPNGVPAGQLPYMQLSERAAAAPESARLSPRNPVTTSQHIYEDRKGGSFDPSSRPIILGSTYEPSWRDYEANGTFQPIEASIKGPSLAPSADIVSREPRRSNATKKLPPPLQTNNLGTELAPRTPPPQRRSKIRTPSQQAEVEKDAVETLLFMSSPGVPGYHPRGAIARTPLRNNFAHRADQTNSSGFSRRDKARGDGEQPEVSCSQNPHGPARKRPLSNAEMDKMLDEMPDASSSDDSELQR